MSKPLTADALIESIKRRASIPENQATFTSEDLLDFANEELQLGVVPGIMSVHEDHLLYEEEVALEANRSDYEIPARALGNKLRDLQHKFDESNIAEMTRIGIGERFNSYGGSTGVSLKQFYVKGNKVVLSGAAESTPSGSLVFVYYIRPSALVLSSKVGIVKNILDNGDGTSKVALDSVPEEFNTSIIYDLYKGDSPASILTKDIKPITLDTVGKSITFNTTDIPKELKKGDHVSLACEANIPQVPSELHPMLAQMVACRVLESMGDTQGLQNALIKLQQMERAAGMLIDNRIDDAPQKVVNRHGVIRTSVFTKRFNRR